MYPNKFGVQFFAYQTEKSMDNLKDSAKRFAELLAAFPTEPELCSEVLAMTSELLKFEELEVPLDKASYPVQLFYQLPQPVQRDLLLNCAKNIHDPLDHCKLMLLLFRKFPSDTHAFGMEVMERLVAAEKTSSANGSPLNCYRKILVCDLLPYLTRNALDVPKNNLLRFLEMAVEFYVTYAFEGSKKQRREDNIPVIEDFWDRLWNAILSIGAKLNWQLALGFSKFWTIEGFFKSQLLLKDSIEEHNTRQMAFCSLIVLLRCVHEYLPLVEAGNQENGYVLVEAFVQPDRMTGSHNMQTTDEHMNSPLLTCGHGASDLLKDKFLNALRCYESLNWNRFICRDYLQLCSSWKVEPWLQTFLVDAATFNGTYDKNLRATRSEDPHLNAILAEINRLGFYFRNSDHLNVVESISKIAGQLSSISSAGSESYNGLTATTSRRRHVHYLPITRPHILAYCVKVMLKMLNKKASDMALGHTLVLSQLNWPEESDFLDEISKVITVRGGFTYPFFSAYIVNIDILERFAYLGGPNGQLPLDIFAGTPMHSQRRMSTGGTDRGAREDFKMAMRAQVARWNDPVDELIIRFLICERDLIQHTFIA